MSQKYREDIMKKGETKEQRFQRIAEKRVRRLIINLKSLANCSNKRLFEWNNEQLKKIWNAIDKELKSCKESFEYPKKDKFTL